MVKVSLQQLTEAASEHTTRTQFKTAHPKWYKHAWRRGTLDQICVHMRDARIKWTKEILQVEALKYQTRSEFSIANPRAFNAARTRNWLSDVCLHMQPKKDTFYLLRVAETNIYKVGLTLEHLGLSRIESLRKRSKQKLNLVVYAPLQDRASPLEKRVLLKGKPIRVEGIKSGEFREFSNVDYQKVLKLISDQITQINEPVPCP